MKIIKKIFESIIGFTLGLIGAILLIPLFLLGLLIYLPSIILQDIWE